jgi:hypothetical protein
MPDKTLSLMAEYRHWRASLPVGAFMLLATYLLVVNVWPQVVDDPNTVFPKAVTRIAWLASPVAVWIVLIALSIMLGAWWGEVCSSLIATLQRLTLLGLPLQDSCSQWTDWQRARLPIRVSEMQHLQNEMRATPDYADLLEGDRRGAYRGFLGEVLSSPYAVIGGNSSSEPELIRSVTDFRLSAGLLPWLPLSLFAVGWNVDPKQNGFAIALFAGALAAVIALLVSIARQARAASSLAARMACTPERLGHHSRAAQGSGTSAQ